MPALTRIPLATVVCPSAPFLAPRLLRATVPATAISAAATFPASLRTFSTTAQCCNNADKGKKSGRSYFLEMRKREKQQANRKAKGKPVAEVSPEVIEMALAMRQALEHRDLSQLMDLYPAALKAGILDSRATHILCQTLHNSVRRDAARQAASQLPALLAFAGQIVSDLKRGLLPPRRPAYVHLLGIYKDSKQFADGYALWQWLTEQDDNHISQNAYGAAIELLSYGNLMSLAELEDLYDEGLKRFPGTFAEYHLSPDAIVPDRTQPVHIIGLPTTLLQGIITARLLSNDWKKAYLGLDTILRLYPGQTPHRIFELFISERPVSEAYSAFLLACRSGVQIGGALLTALLNRLRVSMTQFPAQNDRFTILHAIANALYAHQQCGGGLASVHVGQFIKAFEFMLPEKAAGQDFTPEEAILRDTIATTARDCLAGLLQSGLNKGVQPYVSLISLAGRLRTPDLLQQTLADAKTAGIAFYPVERRTLLAAAGLIRDADLVKALWSISVGAAEKEGTPLSYNDWITFAKACRRVNLAQFVEQQLHEQAHSITSTVERRVRSTMSSPESGDATTSLLLMKPEELNAGIQKLQGQVENMQAVLMSGQPLHRQKSPFYMHIDPEQSSLGSEEDLRAIYDEYATDVHQPAAPVSADGSQPQAIPPALSTTDIPLDELRFRNWVTVHEMMSAASSHTGSLRTNADQAANQRRSSKDSPDVVSLSKITPAQNKADLRDRIQELRTPFRRITSNTKPGTPTLASDILKSKIHKHKTKDFTIRKFETETPEAVYEPRTQDPTTSRWVTRKFTKTYSDNKYDINAVKSKFQAYGDEGQASKKEEL